MSSRSVLYLFFAILLSFSSEASLKASTIFSVGGTIESSQYSLSGVEVAISFIASANETLTGASIVGSGGSLTMQIESNLNNAPSDTALAGGTATANLTNAAVYSATTSLNVVLTKGQEYWVVLSGPASINESSTAAGSVTGVTGDWSSNGGSTWTTEGTGSGYYYPNMTLTGTISPAPEPTTAGLVALPFILFLWFTVASESPKLSNLDWRSAFSRPFIKRPNLSRSGGPDPLGQILQRSVPNVLQTPKFPR